MATNPERTSSGLLQINVINIQNNFPIQNARVTISYKGEPDLSLIHISAFLVILIWGRSWSRMPDASD